MKKITNLLLVILLNGSLSARKPSSLAKANGNGTNWASYATDLENGSKKQAEKLEKQAIELEALKKQAVELEELKKQAIKLEELDNFNVEETLTEPSFFGRTLSKIKDTTLETANGVKNATVWTAKKAWDNKGKVITTTLGLGSVATAATLTYMFPEQRDMYLSLALTNGKTAFDFAAKYAKVAGKIVADKANKFGTTGLITSALALPFVGQINNIAVATVKGVKNATVWTAKKAWDNKGKIATTLVVLYALAQTAYGFQGSLPEFAQNIMNSPYAKWLDNTEFLSSISNNVHNFIAKHSEGFGPRCDDSLGVCNVKDGELLNGIDKIIQEPIESASKSKSIFQSIGKWLTESVSSKDVFNAVKNN